MIDHGANTSIINGNHIALFEAVKGGNVQMVHLLLNSYRTSDIKNKANYHENDISSCINRIQAILQKALLLATDAKKWPIVKLLIEKGAIPDLNTVFKLQTLANGKF